MHNTRCFSALGSQGSCHPASQKEANGFSRQFEASRTEIKGGGLQAMSSSQFSVPAFGSTNFLDPRKLLRTVLSGF